MPNVTVNGRELEVEAGTTIMTAADELGIFIPRYCYHPDLSIAGNCRICLVEVEGMPKLVTSCSTVVTDGMVVRTDTPAVKSAVTAVLEFLLLNHPIDCPICDQAGECYLQDYYMKIGLHESRMPLADKYHKRKAVKLGRTVVMDKERCILCSRCIRFCDEISNTRELAFFNRGNRTEIGTFEDRHIENPYSGNLVDICPVGALTSNDFRFACSVWRLDGGVDSICPECSTGCNMRIDHRNRNVYRFVPRRNPEVNKSWMCDEGRLSYRKLNRTDRLRTPLVRRSGRLEAASWDEALAGAAKQVRAARRSDKKAGALGVPSPRNTNEELYAFKKLLEALEGTSSDWGSNASPVDPAQMEDDLLRRADKNPNSTGIREIGFGSANGGVDLKGALGGVMDGRFKIVYLLGPGLLGSGAPENLAREALGNAEVVILHATVPCPEMDYASVVFPASTYVEKEGTFTNYQRRVQRISMAYEPPPEARPELNVLLDLLKMYGAGLPAADAGGIMDLIASDVRSFNGIKFKNIPPTGALLAREG
jgi:NADH-quinone oxidoreductase subunit G